MSSDKTKIEDESVEESEPNTETTEIDSDKDKNDKLDSTEDNDQDDKEPIEKNTDKKDEKKNGKKVPFYKDIFKNPRKRLIFIIVLGLFLIAVVGTGLYFMLYEKPLKIFTDDTDNKTPKTEAPELFESPLSGLLVEKAASERHPLAVVVENHPDARPQSGLSKADIVYEAIAEGGITRFMAIFGTKEAEKVGPVRSARTFFVDWAHGYLAYLAHVGGNMDALDKIRAEKTFDLDQFANPAPYWREYAAGLATEHTMYTSTIKLRETATGKGYSTTNNFNSWKFKDDPTDKTLLPESQTVNIDFSSAQYAVSYTYDKETNSYKRNMAGKVHTDKQTKEQLVVKNVIVMTVKRQAVVTRINEPGYSMTTVGTGKAKIFLDGKMIDGIWKKQSASDRELFYDENDQEITFNRGQFWISVIPPEGTTTVK